jgi:circadian clock protein KaiB
VSRSVTFKFRLFVAGDTQNSAEALDNLTALCKAHLAGHYEIEVVDVFRDSQRARADGIRMTPALVKFAPIPEQRIIGTLSDTAHVLRMLGLEVSAA